MKSRLTITLTQDILKRIDRLIDGKDIRNRSHAIEHLIRKSLTPSVKTAIILSGGRTERKTPPALTTIDGQQLLFIMINHLKRFGVTDFFICAGPWERDIREVLLNGEAAGIIVKYINEAKPLGTAGAIKNAQKAIPHEPFLVIHGDVLTSLNIEDFILFHENEKSLATIAVKPRIAEKKFGKVLLQGNRITDFYEEEGEKGISIINTGVYLFEPEVLDLIPDEVPSSLEKDVFPQLARMGELSAFLFQGVWFDVSRPKDKKEAILRWKEERR
jgi:NDP-sugar pyrophosphorylase family protein